MGEVFKARNWKLEKVVALKLIRKERLDNPNAVRRFEREVRSAAALSHPNIVLAYDADRIGGTHLLVMECVEGTDLAKLVKKNGPLPVTQACEYIQQTALGLQHAYERGLVEALRFLRWDVLLRTDANKRSMVAALTARRRWRTLASRLRWPCRSKAAIKPGRTALRRLPQMRSAASQRTISACRTASS
jgi:hypothetical protein